MLDLGFVRREVAGFYGSNGHVIGLPVIIIKLMSALCAMMFAASAS